MPDFYINSCAVQTWKLALRAAIWPALSPPRELEEPKPFVIPSTASGFSKLTNQQSNDQRRGRTEIIGLLAYFQQQVILELRFQSWHFAGGGFHRAEVSSIRVIDDAVRAIFQAS